MLGSTIATFIVSAGLSGKMLRPVDIQNATLAGGVCIGATANLNLGPFGAVLIGWAGLLSTLGFCKVQEALLHEVGLHDSCGIHNLHGMPRVLGGLVSVVVPLFLPERPGTALPGKPGNQTLGVVGTLVVSMVTGAITGLVMKTLKDVDASGFDDSEYLEVADDFLEDAKELAIDDPGISA